MPMYALVKLSDGAVLEERNFTASPPVLAAEKDMVWREITAVPCEIWEKYSGINTAAGACARIIENKMTLANWKLFRIGKIRAEQWNRISLAFPIGKVIHYYGIAIKLTFKKASGNNLTAGETNTMSAINNAVVNTIEPISDAADTCCAAIDAASNFAAVETAYAAVAWP